jgi:hypothetical protein
VRDLAWDFPAGLGIDAVSVAMPHFSRTRSQPLRPQGFRDRVGKPGIRMDGDITPSH